PLLTPPPTTQIFTLSLHDALPIFAVHSFPSLRRFLTLAPACWPRGKIPPHPSARSARHSSPQNGGPKGKMIEGRSGGSWRGTRKELRAPPGRLCSTSESHVVSCTDARPSPPTHFPPSAASSPSHLPAVHGETFRRTQAHGSLVAAEWRAQRENDRREERGIWAGHPKRIEGPTWKCRYIRHIRKEGE